MRKRCRANERLNRRKHRSRKLKPNCKTARAGDSDEFDRSDKICRKGEHLVDKLGHLRKWIEKLEVLINDIVELIAGDQRVLTAGIRVVGERKTQPGTVASVDQKLKRVS